MPARSENFPWPSHYGHFNFFEDRMSAHSKVRSLKKLDDGLYKVGLADSRELTVFICECYSYGLAQYAETVEKLGKLDSVIINSNWCGYTVELKVQCRKEAVGLFSVGDFMGAINQHDFWLYLNEQDRKILEKRGQA